MQKYNEYAPTPFDRKGAFIEDEGNWRVAPVVQTRDSGCCELSNYAAALEAIEKIDLEGEWHQEHRFNHWGPGWFEIIIVKPCTPAAIIAKGLELKLEGYPILDEDDFCSRESEAIVEGIPLYIEGELIEDIPEDWVEQLYQEMDYCELAGDESLSFPQGQDPTTLAVDRGWIEGE